MAGLWTARRGADGKDHGPCKLSSLLGLEFALSKSDKLAPSEITRIGLQGDVTFTGSAAALNRSPCVPPKVCWPKIEVRNLCLKIPRKRRGVSLLVSAANAQHCMHVGLDQPAEAPTQTIERVEKALATLQSIERFACDQHDHVSFAKAWMLVAHAVVYDFKLVPPAVMATLQRRLEGGLRQTMVGAPRT